MSATRDIYNAKMSARAQARLRRGRALAGSGNAAERLRDRFLTDIPLPPDPVVGGYWPIGTEVDVRPLLHAVRERGWSCALPVVGERNQPLQFRRWEPGMILRPGAFGIQEPTETAESLLPNVLLVPLLAFDRWGHRLGYGAGFYDRTIVTLRGQTGLLSIGIGFAAQEMPRVPRDVLDQPLDWILTEDRVMRPEPDDNEDADVDEEAGAGGMFTGLAALPTHP